MKTIECEQLYNVWSTEPQLICILDLRSAEEYEELRIPGAQSIKAEQIPERIDREDQRLFVLVHSHELKAAELKAIAWLENVVSLNQCQNWRLLELPMTGRQLLGLGSDHGGQLKLILPDEKYTEFLLLDPQSKEAMAISVKQSSDDESTRDRADCRLIYSLSLVGNDLMLKVEHDQEDARRVQMQDQQVLILGDEQVRCFNFGSGRYALIFGGEALLLGVLNSSENEVFEKLRRRGFSGRAHFYDRISSQVKFCDLKGMTQTRGAV